MTKSMFTMNIKIKSSALTHKNNTKFYWSLISQNFCILFERSAIFVILTQFIIFHLFTEMTEDGCLFINTSAHFYFSSTKYRIERRVGRLLFELIYLWCFFIQRININVGISSFNFIVCLIFIQCAFFMFDMYYGC